MKLSIIIPAYNVEHYISECLYSILPYMTDDCELIIVDDNSTDKTVFMIRTCIMMWSTKNVTLICNPDNRGVSYARNFGLKHATGEYIAFIDGDDYVSRKYIQTLLNAFKLRMDYYLLTWQKVGESSQVYSARALPKWNKSVWSRVIKKSIIRVMFDESMDWAEDVKFLEQNIVRGHKYAYIDEIMYYYRWKRPNSITSIKLGR